jgi:hypothetical protein
LWNQISPAIEVFVSMLLSVHVLLIFGLLSVGGSSMLGDICRDFVREFTSVAIAACARRGEGKARFGGCWRLGLRVGSPAKIS